MNDLTLLATHGPSATDLPADVRDRARTALLGEIAHDRSMRRDAVLAQPRRRRRAVTRIGVVAASVIGAALLAPSLLGLNGSAAVALGPADPMTFPFTPTALPAELGEPVFERDTDFIAARYGSTLDGVSITTGVDDADHWDLPDDAPTVDIAGHTASIVTGTAHDGTTTSAPTVTIIWETDEHAWTAVRGSGTYADAGRVEAIAASLRDEPQPVDLALDVAPRGWSVAAYKEDRVLTLSPDGRTGPDTLTVTVLGDSGTDLSAEAGLRDVATLTVNGRAAQLGTRNGDAGDEVWMLTAQTASGHAFSLQAPAGSFSRDQVVEVAQGVTYRP